MENTGKKRSLSDFEIGEIIGACRPEDDVEVLNEENDEVDPTLEVAIEAEQNCVAVAEFCGSVERCVNDCW